MKRTIFIILAICPSLLVISQEKEEEKKFGITFSGYVKNDLFFDTRQTTAVREGQFLLWPLPEKLDVNGNDINAHQSFNMLAVQSRLSGKISGPDAFGAKTSGVIEGDFFAQLDDNINLFRLRHAYLKLNWANTELLAGQTWNPLFITGCFPGTVSFNTGTPLQSFARNPQIRLTQGIGKFKIMGAILSQRDYSSRGEAGLSSSYLRNSGIPDLHLQLQYETKNEEAGTSFLVGAGIAYKTLVPRLSNIITITPETIEVTINLEDTTATAETIKAITGTYQVNEKVNSMAIIAYTTLKLKPVTIKLQGRYGENIPDVLSASGFAIKEVTDTVTGEQSYAPLRNITVWGEIHTNGKNIQIGLFGGYLHNMGTKDAVSTVDMKNNVFGLAPDIESLIRISPRLIWNSSKVRVALELEYTIADYGSNYDSNYKPANTTRVSNFRTLLSTYYFF